MKTAVIRTGGKQYIVQEGDTLKIEKLAMSIGDTATFSDVLLTATDTVTILGTPLVQGASVEAKIMQEGKAKKVTGVKLKAKKRYRHYFGHRQSYTTIQITAIKTGGQVTTKKTA